MKRKIEILLLSLILTVVVTVGISSATKGLVIQPGDVNGDGAINAKDAVMLAQYLAGWDVILGGDSHTVVIDAAVPATCTQTGLTEGKHCSDCGMILVKQQTVPTIPHDFVETLVQPTTATQGYTLCKCKVCGYEEKKNFIPPVNSNGLAVEVNTANKTCVITGIGTCTDTGINIPAKISDYTVVGIADKAFSEQTQITSIQLPNTVKTLGQRAFYGCTGLTEFTVPAWVASIGHQVFYKCDNLVTVYYNTVYSPSTDIAVLNTTSIKKVVFGGAYVPADVCYNCTNIETVEILDSAKFVNSNAFYGCTKLKVVTIGNKLMSVGSNAFYGCSSLTNIEVPDSVTSIDRSAFSGCSSLESITLPFVGNGGDINSYPFGYIFGTASYIGGVATTQYYPGGSTSYTYYIPSSLKKVTITSENIPYGAFYHCRGLTNIKIGDNIETIGAYAFYGCNSLTNVEIPDSIASIGDSAFEYCNSLKSIDIPDSVTYIGSSVFKNCGSLESLIIPDSVTSIGSSAFNTCSSLVSITVPDSVTSINEYMFEGCGRLTAVVISDSVMSIGSSAFNGCYNLTRVYYGGDATKWAAISIGSSNSYLTSATRYYYSATQPTTTGNYWHYVDGKPTPW